VNSWCAQIGPGDGLRSGRVTRSHSLQRGIEKLLGVLASAVGAGFRVRSRSAQHVEARHRLRERLDARTAGCAGSPSGRSHTRC